MGLILDRPQICEAIGVSDSAIGLWEKEGLPVLQRGRGRGQRSLYDYDQVRRWCKETGRGHGVKALLARARGGADPDALARAVALARIDALETDREYGTLHDPGPYDASDISIFYETFISHLTSRLLQCLGEPWRAAAQRVALPERDSRYASIEEAIAEARAAVPSERGAE